MKDFEAKVIEMYLDGAKVTTIQAELGIGCGNIYRILDENNISRRSPNKKVNRAPKEKQGGRKYKMCPKCKSRSNPAKARYCCMCGADLRSEGDILIERLGNALMLCSTYMPAGAGEATEAIRAAIQYIEKRG